MTDRSENARLNEMADLQAEPIALSLAPAFAALLWPSTVVVRHCVLLEEHFDQANFDLWWQRLEGDRQRIESVINHVHLWDVFSDAGGSREGELLERIAGVMVEAWRCALASRYPDREFEVRATSEPDEYGPTVSFVSLARDE